MELKELQEADIVALALAETTDPKKIAKKTKLSLEIVEERLEQLRELVTDTASNHFLEALDRNNERLNKIINEMMEIVELKKSEKHALAALKAIEIQNNLLGLNSPVRKIVNTNNRTVKLSFNSGEKSE